MSDTQVAQSVVSGKVERCKYGHEWRKGHGDHPIPRMYFECGVCGYRPKEDSRLWHEAEAILHLRDVLKPRDTVYTVLRHVSRSGMSRNIDLYYVRDGAPVWISAYVGHAIGSPQSRKNWERSQGLTVGGCGMDMGFHIVYSLGRVLFRKGFPTVKITRCQKCLDVPGKDGLGRVCKGCNGTGDVTEPVRGRNGDMSGWDNDGGYALQHKWL